MVVPVITAPVSASRIGKDQRANQVYHIVINVVRDCSVISNFIFLKLFVNHRVLMEEPALHQTIVPVLLNGEDLAVKQVGDCA